MPSSPILHAWAKTVGPSPSICSLNRMPGLALATIASVALRNDCLQRTNKDADQIKESVRTRNGKMVWAGAEACARNLGRKRQWDNWARECSDLEYVSIAKVEM